MELFCPNCKEMPLIKFSFFKKGNITVIIKCKCGRKFEFLSTFIVEYTNILKIDNKIKNNESENQNSKLKKDLKYFCETCFQNIYKESNIKREKHHNHKLIKIDKNNLIISEEEFETITKNLEKAEDKINKYLPNMIDMLLKDCKKKSDKKEIEVLSDICL